MMRLSHEPAITATVTAGLGTALAVGAALNAAGLPPDWAWMGTWVPAGIFVAYLLAGLVIRPMVVPVAKLRNTQPDPDGTAQSVGRANTGIPDPGGPSNVRPRLRPGREADRRPPSGGTIT